MTPEIIGITPIILVTLSILNIGIVALGAFWLTSISRNPEASGSMLIAGSMCFAAIEIASLALIGVLLKILGS